MKYPTSEGLPVPLQDIWLPRTKLPEQPRFRNNHHENFTARQMGKLVVTQALYHVEKLV